ncbi:hypothetical protein [Streptomyces xantholiticus]|uniref:MarR family transcriptional regulator n=1 Tax=Streptomyces xantholiticus TaxID=68285 RepID=A0ABV1UZV9_9ACTN
MRRRVLTITLPRREAEAEYPEYDKVRAEAERRDRGPLDPQALKEMEAVAHRRGHNWCTAVIGRTFGGIAYTPSTDAFMLLVADGMGLEPPLPQRIVEARRTFDEQRGEDRKRRERVLEQERQRWELALSTCPVAVTVRANVKRGGGRALLHAVTDVPVRSSRGVHPAGRALCEHKRNPRTLGEPIADGVATCQSCVKYVAEIRPMDAPMPTKAERALLQLIATGVVFTMTHARTAPTVRVTTERSKGRAGGLGRSVDAAVRKLEAKGWVASDAERSATETGHYGDRWRLTEAGTAALEG